MATDFADSERSGDESGTHPSISNESQSLAEWEGNDRYRIVRKIGAGGMGVVYEAFDRHRERAVALKRLLHFTPATLYRFKQEFRTLADVQHPNLVRLHELVMTERDGVFFTMELVFGTDFLTYVSGESSRPSADERSHVIPLALPASELPTVAGPTRGSGRRIRPPAPWPRPPVDFEKLRRSMRQLVDGVHALHGAGKLHRDIKPSNVLITDEGRVVILDFGVATQMPRTSSEDPAEASEIVGTFTYMAHEQAFSETPTPASDWYSVGVVLFEALVGRPPFSGSTIDVLTRKALGDAPAPSECVEDVPADLDALCRALLARDPEARPTGLEILNRLGVPRSVRPVASPLPAAISASASVLIGREGHLCALADAFEQVKRGCLTVVRIAGGSGMGKSTLVQHFIDGLQERDEAVVLSGRTYERESVPFKAVDSIIDAFSRHLVWLETEGEAVELPRDIGALARMFPVLRRVRSIETWAHGEIEDPQLVRRRAFSALRELIGVLAMRRPLVIYMDDVQWGDADSAALLLELIRPPDAPPTLFIATHRQSALETSPFLKELQDHWPENVNVSDLTVGPLDAEDARRLALSLLQASDEIAQRTARAVARESRGSPFLIEELVRSNLGVPAGRDGQTLATVTFHQMVNQRRARLPREARRVLEIVAVGGRPLAVPVVANASGTGGAVEDAIALVVAKRFVRTGLRDGREVVEMSHDRFRETILAGLPHDILREHHGRLARALELAAVADAEAIGMHLLGAGEDTRAATYLEEAAEEAFAKLAFEQAARLFRLALEIAPASTEDARRLRTRLALVMEWAGRGEEASRAYLDAAAGAPPLERAELERAAAIELLASGRMIEGAQVLHRVLAAVGLAAPRTVVGAVFWLLIYRLRLALSAFLGLPFEARTAESVPRLERARVEAVFSAAIGFAFTDVILGTCMAARSMVLALRFGDRFQILRAALLEASQHAGLGGNRGKLEQALVDLSKRLVEEDGTPQAMGFLQGNLGLAMYLRGDWREALELLDGASSQARVHDHRAGWQTSIKVFACWSLNFLGEHLELARRHKALLADAEERGDRYTSVQLRDGSLAILWLAADDPQGARCNAEEAIASWPRDRYLLQHWHMMYGEGEIELYSGEGANAYARIQRDERALKKSLLLNVQHMRVQTAFLRGRCAIASLATQPAARVERLAEVRRIARRLTKEARPWSAPFAAILTAAAANVEGDQTSAVLALRMAVELAHAADMRGYANASQYQLGNLLGGDEGQKLRTTAEERMVAQGIRVPACFAATLVPGRWGAR